MGLSAELLVCVLLMLFCTKEECRLVGKKKLSLALDVSPAMVAARDDSAEVDKAGLLATGASLLVFAAAAVGPAELPAPVPQDRAPLEPLMRLLRGEPRGLPGDVINTPLEVLLAAVAQVLLSRELLMPLTSIGWLWLFLMPCSRVACSNAL